MLSTCADGSLAARVPEVELPPGVKEWTLLDMQSGFPTEPRWLQLDDSIMGGVSTSTLVYDDAEQAVAFMGESWHYGVWDTGTTSTQQIFLNLHMVFHSSLTMH